jgi:hypothetical protein
MMNGIGGSTLRPRPLTRSISSMDGLFATLALREKAGLTSGTSARPGALAARELSQAIGVRRH